MKNLSEKDVMAMLNVLNFNAFYFPTLMPFRFTPSLTWKTLAANAGVPIAADVINYDSKAPRKTRQVVTKLTGDIPKIAISREKGESEINEYNQLLQYANTDAGARELVKFVFDDVDYCWQGVGARLEWLMLRAVSTGKVILTADNNNGIVTENNIDFLVPSAQQRGVTTAWSVANKATCTPITDIKAVVALGKAAGKPLNYILMNKTTFDIFQVCTEVITFCAAFYAQAMALNVVPTLDTINKTLQANMLPEIRVIDANVTIEKEDGTQTTVNPFETGAVTFVPSLNLGNVFHSTLADETIPESSAIKVKREAIMVKKYAVEEPLTEVTIGMANAFPVWNSSQNSYLLDTLHNSFSL